MSTEEIIPYITQNLKPELKNQLLWYDGSGLSRYNIFTASPIVQVLIKIKELIPMEQILDIFSARGINDTPGSQLLARPPDIYEKTDTLRKKHCLSGYLIADIGKPSIFSFMHNNFPGGSFTINAAGTAIY